MSDQHDIKELKKLLQMLRGQGVLEFKGAGIEVRLGELPTETGLEPEARPAQEPQMTDEELLMWSAGANG